MDNLVVLGKMNNDWTLLVTSSLTINFNTLYQLKVVTSGSSIQVYVDNVLHINTTDAQHASGAIGLRSYQANAEWDNITHD